MFLSLHNLSLWAMDLVFPDGTEFCGYDMLSSSLGKDRVKNDPLPQDVHILIPGTCQYVTLRGRKDFADVITLRNLGWGNYLGGAHVITSVTEGETRRTRRVGDVPRQPEDGGRWERCHAPRRAVGLWKPAKMGRQSFHQSLWKKHQPADPWFYPHDTDFKTLIARNIR